VLSYPTKRVYLVGEKFDISGLKVVDYVNDKENDISDNILFYTSDSVRLTQSMPFTTAGTMLVQLKHTSGKVVGQYFVTVMNMIIDTDQTIYTDKITDTNKTALNHPFTDVASGAYYEVPVVWALNNGITTGTSATTFSPNATCTRGEAVTFLWRSKGKPASKSSSSLAAKYSGKFYTDAVAWADTTGLLSGTGTAFLPSNNSPRADIVTYLYRNAGSPDVNTSVTAQ